MHDIIPVKRIRNPTYPDKEFIRVYPELLDMLPVRWQRSRKAAAAAGLLATMTFSLAACKTATTAGVSLPPEIISESDAMRIIKDAAGSLLSDSQQNYSPSDSADPITYVQYVAAEKVFKEVTLITSGETLDIDTFNTDERVGFEYINPFDKSEKVIGYQDTRRNVDHADKDSAWVLVINMANKDDPDAEKQIQEQVRSFISWLKAEGIV